MLLDTAAGVLTISYGGIRLHRLHAVQQAHAVLAPAACGTIAAAMKYLSAHLIRTNTCEGQGSLHLCWLVLLDVLSSVFE
jgi:hypothetical protein